MLASDATAQVVRGLLLARPGSSRIQLDKVQAAARAFLIVRAPSAGDDLWLWEHSERVMNMARMVSLLPEFGQDRPDATAVVVAALFHDAGWAVQLRQGVVKPAQILARPTSDMQRELGAVAMHEQTGKLLPDEIRTVAAEAIRRYNDRGAATPEARAISEADNLDDIGLMYALRQFRLSQAEGRPIEQLVINWSRQIEYRYWEARINDSLRFETVRQIARERLKGVEQFMAVLARDREASDLWRALKSAGVDPSAAIQPLGSGE